MFALLLAAAFALAAVATLAVLLFGYSRVPMLRDVEPTADPLPGVSAVTRA